jgi:hypothetical protein
VSSGEGRQKTSLVSILRNLAAKPEYATVLLRKLLKRFDGKGRYSQADNDAWIAQHQVRAEAYAKARDSALWTEALEFGEQLRERAAPILARIPFDMGAGGDYEFLYWLTRRIRPETVIETGVSSGWSSQAILAAMEKNGSGFLHRSDFPFFRVESPEQYVGILVEDRLKHRWKLHLDGDEHALPRILDECGRVDLFHYDSDKSLSGRRFAYGLVAPRLHGPLLFDDIHDDSYFRELAESLDRPFDVLLARKDHIFGLIEPPGANPI